MSYVLSTNAIYIRTITVVILRIYGAGAGGRSRSLRRKRSYREGSLFDDLRVSFFYYCMPLNRCNVVRVVFFGFMIYTIGKE